VGPGSGFQVNFSSSDPQQVYSQFVFFTAQTELENGWGTSLANAKAEVHSGQETGRGSGLEIDREG
jgi:hypothetical protein